MAVVEAHQLAQRKLLTRELADERRRRERAEASESKIRQALALKDMAVHEANHRITNTLQVAASLLSLHARATKSAQVRAALEESHGRLRLLAKVHEMLYAGTEGTEEILMPTLLQAMGDALRQSFAEVASRVKLQVTSEQIVLPPDDAIPIALLANEVMTNAYKHAFPEGSSGMVSLDLGGTPQSTIILRIMDNGIGMRPSNGENGLGLQLIRGFAAQLHATLAFDKPEDTEGTVVTLRIHRGAH